MRKTLLFSLLTTCLCTSLIGYTDHQSRDEADDNEYDLYERNEDQEDFDPYNFPENSTNQSENMRHWSQKEGNMLRRETRERRPLDQYGSYNERYGNYTADRGDYVCPHCHRNH